MSTRGGSPNILLVIMDDAGADTFEVGRLFAAPVATPVLSSLPRQIRVVTYDGLTQISGALPTLSLLLRNGVYFQQAWAQPSCSPTRASIYTGLHPWKSGVGSPTGTPELDPSVSFTTLPELLPNDYVSGLFGKWHLGERAGTRPTDHGWDKHIGTLGGELPDYLEWHVADSDTGYAPVLTTDYATRRTVKEACAWINAHDPATPWFATVAFHAPHEPFHIPPHGYDPATAGDPASTAYMFNVMVQNLVTNIGALLGITRGGGQAALDFAPIPQAQLRNTVIICLGDNGSHRDIAIQEAKTFAYEGSVRVPLIIADGHAVVNEINTQARTPRFLHASRLDTEDQHMVHAVDLYMTIARLADPSSSLPSTTDSTDLGWMLTTPPQPTVSRRLDPVDPEDLDPVLHAGRRYNFAQWYTDTTKRATIRNSQYKLNYDAQGSEAPVYALYRYVNGEIPGREDDGTAINLYDVAVSGADQDARDNLHALLDELIEHYQPTPTESFGPRPF